MSLLPILTSLGVVTGIVLPKPVERLIEALDPGPIPETPPTSGTVTLQAEVPLVLGIALPASAAIAWKVDPVAGGAELRLTIGAEISTPAIPAVFEADVTATGVGATARMKYTATVSGLRFSVGGTIVVRLTTAGAELRLERLKLTPSKPDVALQGGFGLTLPAAFEIVDSALAFEELKLVVPEIVPLLGGLPLTASLTPAASGAAGTQTLHVEIPPTGDDPKVSGSVTWQLGPEFSIADLVPTALELALELPSGTSPLGAAGPEIDETITVRAAISRPIDDPAALTVAVTAESDGADGLASGESSGAGDIALGITIALGPAIAARAGSLGTAAVGTLFAAAAALGTRLAESGGYTLHGVTLEAAPLDGVLTVGLDVSGAVDIVDMNLGVAKITMDDDRPMRVRWRGITATVDLAASDPAQALDLDFRSARADLVDPGGWQVDTIGDVLEIVGTRSGNGSTWFEVDLRFALDLGPVKVSGATVRGTWDSGTPSFGIRGLDASLDLPGVVRGGGSFELAGASGADAGGVDITLWGTLIPLNVGGFLKFGMHPGAAGAPTRFEFALGIDLPAAVPLGPTGLGLYSVAASFGANAGMTPLDPQDPLGSLRAWMPWEGLQTSAGDITIGAGVVVGTVPDGGLAFSALGVLGLTVPDFALRVGLNATLLSGSRQTTAALMAGDAAGGPGAGLAIFGGLSATADALDIGVEGTYTLPNVLRIRIPIAAHFPFGDGDWYLHAGSDRGMSSVDRPPGPMQATVFPGIPVLETGGWAFFMVRGAGIPDLAGTGRSPGGFAVAVGVGFEKSFGAVGVLWAKVSASLIAAIGTDPLMVWAQGKLAGEVGIGPFRLGVDALIEIQFGPHGRLGFHFRVCAVVDLWFTTLEGCIEIGQLDGAIEPPPEPGDEDWPWPSAVLADGLGRVMPEESGALAPAPTIGAVDAASAPAAPTTWSSTPTVWADVIPLLTFPIAPVPGAGTPPTSGTANTGVSGAGTTTFRWTLVALELQAVDAGGAPIGAPVPLDRAAWQPAPGVAPDAAAVATSRQLALLTRSRSISLVHVADGGAGQPEDRDPLRAIAGLCGLRFQPGRAWSYGADARHASGADEWHVPRRGDAPPVSPVLGAFARGVGFRVLTPTPLFESPAVMGVDQASGPWAYPGPVAVSFPVSGGREDEAFTGALRVRSPQLGVWSPDAVGSVRYGIVLDEPIVSGDLLLRVRLVGIDAERGLEEFASEARRGAVAGHAAGDEPAEVTVERGDEPDEGIMRITVPEGRATARITWTMTWAATVDVLGLHAMSVADADEAAAAERDRAKTVADDAAGAAAGADPSGQRTMLEAGMRYRLSATLAWERRTDDGAGNITTDPGRHRTASWFFRTAPKPSTTGGGSGATTTALGVTLPELQLAIDRFDPRYLERYLLGYSIPDHETFVFTKDRPSARFSAPHVRALAERYGRELALLLRRTDRRYPPKSATPPIVGVFVKPKLPLVDLVSPAAAAFGCPLPPRSVETVWPGPLEPSTPYELAVALPPTGEDAVAGSPQLRRITFVTSAFDGPQSLVASLGLTRSVSSSAIASASASGHLPVATVSLAAGLVDGDDAFETAIHELGLPPLRAGGPARSSVLWTRLADGRWAFSGVLLEATEPLVRDGGRRMNVKEAVLGRASLPVRRLDRSGTRALWLAAAPIVATAPQPLRITVSDRTTEFFMRITVPPEPAFAGSAIVGRSRP